MKTAMTSNAYGRYISSPQGLPRCIEGFEGGLFLVVGVDGVYLYHGV
jgi:hypothetical protein